MTTATQVDAAGTPGAFSGDESGGGRWSEAFRRLRRNPVAILGALLVLAFLFVAAFAPLLAGHDPNDQILLGEVRPGSAPGPRPGFPLGADQLGRDELSRLLSGRNGRDGRPVVVTAGGRPPHPPRVDIYSEIIPCPRRVDWSAIIARLQKIPAISFGALCDPDAVGDIWRDLGRNAMGTVDRVDLPGFARQLGLAGRTQALPFPLLGPGTAVGRAPGLAASRDDPVQRGGIAMLGPPGSGKTTFLGAVSAVLQRRQQEQQGGAPAGRPDDPMRLMIETPGAPLPSTGLLPATLTDEPVQFDLIRPEARGAEVARRDRPREVARRSTEITLNLVDPAGELWSDLSPRPGQRHRQEMIRHIAGADGLLYLFDPIREFDTGDALPAINRFLAQVRREVGGGSQQDSDGTLSHHVAVCVTKFDHPRVLATTRRMGLVTTDPDDACGFPRVRDRDARQVFARLCNGNGQALLDTIDGAFHEDRVRYFVTSAIGFHVNPETGRFDAGDPENSVRASTGPGPGGQENEGPVSLNPINVVEPVLWLAGQIAAV